MAKWAEIEAVAESYEAKLKAQTNAEAVKRQEELAAKRESINKAREMFEETFTSLNVRGALEAVRDEKWHEGDIETFDNSQDLTELGQFRYSLMLSSNPYRRIDVSYSTRYSAWITLESKRAEVGVWVKPRNNLSQLTPEPTSFQLQAFDYNIYPFLDNPASVDPTFLDRVKKIPLKGDLGGFLKESIDMGNHAKNFYTNIDLIDPELEQKFYHFLRNSERCRVELQSMPSQIRRCGEERIALFPKELKDTGRLDGDGVRNWYHDLRGANRLAHWFDWLVNID